MTRISDKYWLFNAYPTRILKASKALILTGLLFLNFNLTAQISYDQLKAALIIRLSDKVSWPADNKIDRYTIGVLGKDKNTFDLLQQNQSSIKINDKPYRAVRINSLLVLDDINILYVDKSNAKNIEKISEAIEGKNILLISENFDDPKYIMLNILSNQQNNSVSFEANKANIILEDLSFDTDILLLGGTAIDIRELYREIKVQFEREKRELAQQKEIGDLQALEIKEQQTTMEQQADELHKQSDKINSLADEISQMDQIRNTLSKRISEKESSIGHQTDLIDNQLSKIELQDKELHQQIELIAARSTRLDSLELATDQQLEVITNQEAVLSNKEALINSQKNLIWSIAVFSVLILISIVLLIRALNSKRKTYNELEVAQDQLIQQEKMASLGILTAGVAHEIKNPLNFIGSGVTIMRRYMVPSDQNKGELIINAKDAESVAQIMDHVDIGVQRTVEIVKSLGLLSRRESGKFMDCSIHDVINSSLTILSHEHKGRVDILQKYSRKKNIIQGQEPRLFQLFTNLLSNAMQAIKGDGSITIETIVDRESNESIIILTDTGSGISDKNMKSIFDPFFTTKEPGKGTGLGLSIVFNIVNEHKGSIKFDSDGQSWTSVRVCFPIGA
ncbi:MAG: YfiR/HmsC family protein [Reichenbachiella sp.]